MDNLSFSQYKSTFHKQDKERSTEEKKSKETLALRHLQRALKNPVSQAPNSARNAVAQRVLGVLSNLQGNPFLLISCISPVCKAYNSCRDGFFPLLPGSPCTNPAFRGLVSGCCLLVTFLNMEIDMVRESN
jgi:hypothetical protein